MRQFLSRIPIPICGLALGMASLDLLLSRTYEFYEYSVLALLSFFLAVLFTLRIVADPRGIAKDLENSAIFGVLPTYTMTLMLLSTYAHGLIGDIALGIWLASIAASFVFMFFFVKRFFFDFSIEKVFPAWVVIFVGYVVASVTSPEFGMQELGKILFWSGFTGCLTILPLAIYRVLKVRKIPESLLPSITIIAAPANLATVGCLTAFGDAPPEIALAVVASIGIVCYVAVLIYMPVMLKNTTFYPSYAAFTFPVVIASVSLYRLGDFYGWSSNGVFVFVRETAVLIAVLIVLYVLIRYLVFLYRTARGPPATAARGT